MSEHFLQHIAIDNYKCFDNFKVENFKRVNLIAGKNNVGKTALMEACYINVEVNSSKALQSIIEGRYLSDFFGELLKEVGSQYIMNIVNEKAKVFDGFRIFSNHNEAKNSYDTKELKVQNKKNIFYMNSYRISSKSLDTLYSTILENRLESEIDKNLHQFDKNLDSFRIMSSEAKCSVVNGSFRNINEFGDGVSRYITYLCIFYTVQDGIIFVDEIDNGIHHTKFDEMWKIILQLSKQNNVQVFATTHSKECIESYARVSKELEDEDIAFVELGVNKYKELDSIVMNSEQFHRFVKIGNEVRGW